MGSRKLVLTVVALIFLLITATALYRLLVGFPMSIGGEEIGQVSTFFVLVCGAALTLMMFNEARK
jgi:hypothetical protein